MNNSEITQEIAQETAQFDLMQRQSKLLASSSLVPKEFQGNMSNCYIGLNIAKRLGADPFCVLQNIDIIHGRPSFRATFLIAMVNASGRFTPLQFRLTGQGPSRACVAHCKARDTGEAIEGPEITMEMAKAEGWSTKAGSKWITMPELMLRYRAAAFFARLYAPDITLGMHTSEEIIDVEEPRMASGRVVNESAKLANPYEETETLPPMDPQPTGEPPMESTVEVSESTERLELYGDIQETCREVSVSMATFEGRAKKAGLMDKEETLKTVRVDYLRVIHSNRMAIAMGEKIGGES